MTMKIWIRGILGIGLSVCFSTVLRAENLRPYAEATKQDIWSQIPQPSGLIVQVGGGEVLQLAQMARDYRILTHMLCDDLTEVSKARAFLRKQSLYGKVMVEHWPHSYLPYIDNNFILG